MGAIQQVIAAVGGAEPSPLLTGLVAYWKLDEASGTRIDATGRGNDLTDNNTVTSNTGIISNAAEFVRANSEYLSRGSNADLQAAGDFTISAWIYSGDFFIAETLQVVAKDVNTPASSRDYTLDVFQQKARFYVAGGGGGIAQHATELASDTWHHIIAWYVASGPTVNIVLNAGATTSAASSAADVSAAQFRIGGRAYSGFEDYYNGRIDEVGIWHRVLTADERTELYNSGSGLTYPFA